MSRWIVEQHGHVSMRSKLREAVRVTKRDTFDDLVVRSFGFQYDLQVTEEALEQIVYPTDSGQMTSQSFVLRIRFL